MITRRGLLAGILSAGFAPAAIGSGILMPVKTIARVDPFGGFTAPNEQGYLVFVHPDEGMWWREQGGFIPVEQYGRMQPLSGELGSISGGIRLIESRGPA